MTALQKATLQAVKGDRNETTDGDPVEVQFNPTTLSLKLKNAVEGGRSRGKQRRQQTGANSNTLSMELIFDTADEGEPDAPVSVRTRTAIVERFVVPPLESSDPPPRLRFEWGDGLEFLGIVEDVSIDFELFAANGVPLRAKVDLSLKEQKREYQYLAAGAGSRTSDGTEDPGGAGASSAPGAGTNAPDAPAAAPEQVAPALDGESPAEFMDRMGLDPEAWRGLGADMSLGLGFEAGLEVGFSASLGLSAGIGFSAGVQAGIGLSLEASVGLSAGVGASIGAGAGGGGGAGGSLDGDAAGKAMAELGGVAAASDAVEIARADAASSATVRAFDQPEASGGGATLSAAASPPAAAAPRDPAAPAGAPVLRIDRAPLSRTGPRTQGEQAAAGPRLPLPAPDPRAVSFGFGVPLQPLRATTTALQEERLCARTAGRGSVMPPLRLDPATAPWVALPAVSDIRRRADAREREKEASPCDLVAVHCRCELP